MMLQSCILLQSTGLKDKNGKEIFEGDIIKLYHMDKGERGLKWIIEWDKDRASFIINRHRAIKLNSKWTTKELKIIGNIYENPELLEGGKAMNGEENQPEIIYANKYVDRAYNLKEEWK